MRISFDCPNCGHEVQDDVEDAYYNWGEEEDYDRIGFEISEVTCPCGEIFNVEVTAEAQGKSVEVDGFPEVEVHFHDDTHDPDYDEFQTDLSPIDAFEVYKESVREAKSLETNSYISGIPGQVLLKVLYLQYVVILEAYLSDRLINIVSNDDKKMLALINSVERLRTSSHQLADIARDPLLVKKTVRGFLQRVSFHDLGKVGGFYDAVLGVYIFADERPENLSKRKKAEERLPPPAERRMSEIIQVRHHLVHRNGRDNDGNAIPIELEQVEEVAKLVDEMVRRVEAAYVPYAKERTSRLKNKVPYEPKF